MNSPDSTAFVEAHFRAMRRVLDNEAFTVDLLAKAYGATHIRPPLMRRAGPRHANAIPVWSMWYWRHAPWWMQFDANSMGANFHLGEHPACACQLPLLCIRC